MSTWLLEGFLSFLLFFALLPTVTAPLIFVIYRRYGHAAPRPMVLALLAGLYACALFSFTTFRCRAPEGVHLRHDDRELDGTS